MSVSGLSNLAIVQMGKTVDSTYYIENIRKKELKSVLNGTRTNGKNKLGKGAKIRNRSNLVPHMTQDTNGKVTNSKTGTQPLFGCLYAELGYST